MKYLSRADEILLLSILRLKDNAYGVTIVEEVHKRTGKKLAFGGLWVSLDNLYKKGYVKKRFADPTPERGGRGKIYYKVTPEGLKALDKARELSTILWEGLPDVLLNNI